MTPSGDVTQALAQASAGDADAAERLWKLVYDELHAIARHRRRRDAAPHTLSTTALVHEAYLRLVEHDAVSARDRGHFFAVASQTMRWVLVDRARRHLAQKRGGGQFDVELDEVVHGGDSDTEERLADVLAVHTALEKLERVNERLGKVVELRYFGGLSIEETADVLGISERTVKRDFARARAWLTRALDGDPDLEGGPDDAVES